MKMLETLKEEIITFFVMLIVTIKYSYELNKKDNIVPFVFILPMFLIGFFFGYPYVRWKNHHHTTEGGDG